MKNHDAVWNLIDDMTPEELSTLGDLVSGLNPLEIEDGAAKYTPDEIDLIGRFKDVENDDENEDAEDEEIGEEETTEQAAEQNFQANSFAPEA